MNDARLAVGVIHQVSLDVPHNMSHAESLCVPQPLHLVLYQLFAHPSISAATCNNTKVLCVTWESCVMQPTPFYLQHV